MRRNPLWLMENMRIDEVRQQAELMEIEASTYIFKAAAQAQDVEIRKLLVIWLWQSVDMKPEPSRLNLGTQECL